MTVQLKSSKTDVFRHGQSFTVARSSSTICAVMAMRDYFLLARPQRGPLFYFQSGRYLTRGVVSHLLARQRKVCGSSLPMPQELSYRGGIGCRRCWLSRLAYKSAWSLVVRLLPALHQNSAVSLAFSCP